MQLSWRCVKRTKAGRGGEGIKIEIRISNSRSGVRAGDEWIMVEMRCTA